MVSLGTLMAIISNRLDELTGSWAPYSCDSVEEVQTDLVGFFTANGHLTERKLNVTEVVLSCLKNNKSYLSLNTAFG